MRGGGDSAATRFQLAELGSRFAPSTNANTAQAAMTNAKVASVVNELAALESNPMPMMGRELPAYMKRM